MNPFKNFMLIWTIAAVFFVCLTSARDSDEKKLSNLIATKVDKNKIELKWSSTYTLVEKIKRYRVNVVSSKYGTFQWPAQIDTESAYDADIFLLNDFRACALKCIDSLSCVSFFTTNSDQKCLLSVDEKTYEWRVVTTQQQQPNILVLKNLPYHSNYKIQVSFYDTQTQAWTEYSDFSNEVNDYTDLKIETKHLYSNPTAIRLYWKQVEPFASHSIAKYLVKYSAAGPSHGYTQNENFNRQYTFRTIYTFNPNDSRQVASGVANLLECQNKCLVDTDCINIRFTNDKKCFLSTKIDLLTQQACPSNSNCMEITNKENEFLLENLDENKKYSVVVEYITRYGSRGVSNVHHFQTDPIEERTLSLLNFTRYQEFSILVWSSLTIKAEIECIEIFISQPSVATYQQTKTIVNCEKTVLQGYAILREPIDNKSTIRIKIKNSNILSNEIKLDVGQDDNADDKHSSFFSKLFLLKFLFNPFFLVALLGAGLIASLSFNFVLFRKTRRALTPSTEIRYNILSS